MSARGPRGHDRGRDESGAPIVPIETVTREATWRRFAELERKADPAPEWVLEAAADVASHRWRSIDDELAVLEYDSDLDETLLDQVRALPGSIRQLTFRAPQLSLEVEVVGTIPRRLTCQVVPLQPAWLEVRLSGGRHVEMARSRGTFVVAPLPSGPISLRCRTGEGEGSSVATSWFRI